MKKTFFLATLLLLSLAVSAQIVEPIRWDIRIKQVQGNDYQLIYHASIEKGWHLYGTNLPEGGPVSTSFNYETKKGLTLVGNTASTTRPITKKDEIFDLVLSWYVNEVTFVQKLTVTDPKTFLLLGHVQFMGCDDQSCLPPSPADFKFDKSSLVVDGAKAGSKTSSDGTSISAKPGSKSSTLSADPASNGSSISAESASNGSSISSDIASNGSSFTQTNTSGDSAQSIASQSDNELTKSKLETDPLWKPVISELRTFNTANKPNADHGSWWFLFISGFLGGLLALLTPCVWPIIPMTVSFFLKRNKNRRKAVREALLYGFSIIVIYLMLGIGITLLFGASALNSLSTNAFFNLLFFALLVFFAVSFFGAFEIVLPSSWTNKMDRKADSTSGILSIFFMAFTLALVSFSCTGPIIGTLLVEAATTGSVAGPAVGMFGFALALAIPFALFAIFPNMLQRLPKSGGWLQTVKVVLGFLELAFALKFLSVADLAYGWGILPRPVFLVLWIAIFGIMGLWLIFKAREFSWLRTVSGLVSFAFAAWMVSGLWGAPLRSISAFAPPATHQDAKLYNQQVHAKFMDYEDGMAYAASQGKPVLIDFSGYGCVNCRKMENSVWQDAEVKAILENDYVLITLMVDDKTALDSAYVVVENGRNRNIRSIGDQWSYLQRCKFGANAQPFYVLLTPSGELLGPSRAYDEDVNAYLRFLKDGLKAFHKAL
jgi:thiol:disulfide interchange protein